MIQDIFNVFFAFFLYKFLFFISFWKYLIKNSEINYIVQYFLLFINIKFIILKQIIYTIFFQFSQVFFQTLCNSLFTSSILSIISLHSLQFKTSKQSYSFESFFAISFVLSVDFKSATIIFFR